VLGDDKKWSFYLINDSQIVLDLAVVETVGHEWGATGPSTHPDVRVADLVPGAHRLIWRDDDHELRMWFSLRVRASDREVRLLFEFPYLWKKDLQMVDEVNKPGWVVTGG
jgi:hypothetical protein